MLNVKPVVAGIALFAGLVAVSTAIAEEVKTDATPAETAAESALVDAATAPKVEVAIAGDAVAGAKVFRKCKACHDVEGKNKVGPHLDGVIGRPVASVEGFKYSPAIVEYAAGQPDWTVEALTAFLRKPKDVIAKTKMSFAGLKKDEDLINILAYLNDPSAVK